MCRRFNIVFDESLLEVFKDSLVYLVHVILFLTLVRWMDTELNDTDFTPSKTVDVGRN